MKTSLFKNFSIEKRQLLGLISVSMLSSALSYPIVKLFLEFDSLASRLKVSIYILAISLFFTVAIGLINHKLTMGTDDRGFFNIIIFILTGTSAVLVGLGLFLLIYSLILY